MAQAHRLKLCQRVELPPSLKAIFRRPADEDKWDKLEEARLAIARCIQGEKDLVDISEGDVADLVAALERSTSVYPDAPCGHERFPDGSRVLVEQPLADLSLAWQRAMICTAVENCVGGTITVRTRPLSMNPPLDAFAKAACDPKMTVKLIAGSTK